MSAIKKIVLIALAAISAPTNLNAMEWVQDNVLHPTLKTISPTYLVSHLTQDTSCKTLIDQGKTIPSERSLDAKTSALLEKMINRKRDAHKIIFDHLLEGKIKEAEEFCATIPFHLIQPLVRLFALGHIEKFKKTEREKAEQIATLLHPSHSNRTTTSESFATPQTEAPTALALHAANNSKSGLVHYFSKWRLPSYRIEHLQDAKSVQICKGLKDQAIKSPTSPAIDQDTYDELCQFSERCLLASRTVIDFLKASDENSLNDLRKLYTRLTTKTEKDADLHDLFCPIIQLFALRGLIQYQKSITQNVKKIESNVMQEEPLIKEPAFPTGNYLDAQSLENTLIDRESEYNTMRDALREKMNPTKKSPTASPIRKDSAPTEHSNPLPIPTPQNTSPAKSANSLPKATILVPEAPVAPAMPIMPAPAAPRKPSPKTAEILADLASAPLPIPPGLPRSNVSEHDASTLSYPASSTSAPSTSPESTTSLLASSVPEKTNAGRSLMSRKKDGAVLAKRLQDLFPEKKG
jgi:hypothetical protein